MAAAAGAEACGAGFGGSGEEADVVAGRGAAGASGAAKDACGGDGVDEAAGCGIAGEDGGPGAGFVYWRRGRIGELGVDGVHEGVNLLMLARVRGFRGKNYPGLAVRVKERRDGPGGGLSGVEV